MTNNEKKIWDNVFTPKEHKFISKYCRESHYEWGERDMPDSPPCGMIHSILGSERIHSLVRNKIEKELYPDATQFTLYRMYINLFSPNDQPCFHMDGPKGQAGLSFLYYANNEEWNINDGGETQFYIDGTLTAVPPVPNRMVVFNPEQWHCAMSFRKRYRFTLAVKYA